jgi:hypothetical protein
MDENDLLLSEFILSAITNLRFKKELLMRVEMFIFNIFRFQCI